MKKVRQPKAAAQKMQTPIVAKQLSINEKNSIIFQAEICIFIKFILKYEYSKINPYKNTELFPKCILICCLAHLLYHIIWGIFKTFLKMVVKFEIDKKKGVSERILLKSFISLLRKEEVQ